MIPLDFSKFKAVIFDMDGTMINNMPYHKKSWFIFCHNHGLSLTEDEVRTKMSGRKNDQILELLFNRKLTSDEIAKYSEEKEATYRELYVTDIREVPGLKNLILDIQQRGLKLAIATTAPKKNREFCLQALQLEQTFPVILGDEDVVMGKPDPEIYLKTATKLGVEPSQCLVFEDSPPGVQAGKAAGMTVVGVLTTHSPEEIKLADYLVTDFTELL